MLAGKWTYRSYRNDPALVGDDAAAALGMIFGEGVFDFEPVPDGSFRGGLGMGSGYALSLTAELVPGAAGEPPCYAIIGLGIAGTATEGWRYDYRCTPGYQWPEGKEQVPSLLGTVVRVNAHGPNAPAGFTASFIAVRRPEAAGPRTARDFALTKGL